VSNSLENALAECLEAMEEGRLSIEQCRERYPEDWKELRQLLPLVSTLREAPSVIPSFNFRRDSRRHLIAQLPPRTSSSGIDWVLSRLSSLFKWGNVYTIKPAMQLIAILLAIIILGTGVGVAYASDDSLPGDTLYPIKIVVEKLQMLLTFDDANEAQLQISFAQRRIGEMKVLAERGGFEDIQTAAEGYQSLLNITNETLRGMVLAGDPRTAEIGSLVEETLFYDTLILTGLKDIVPTDLQGTIDFAIGASKSGNAIARQWVGLSTSSALGTPSQLPAITQISEDLGIPLPTDIACWPSELGGEPPDGVPTCEEDQTPVPLPQNLILFCWPQEIPFDPPQRIPRCEEGQEPIKLPDTLNLICWPRELSYDPPEGLRLCNVGELPLPLPENLDLRCWPSEIPYDPPDGIPYCTDGSYPTPAPQQLPCWPRQLPSDPPPGIPLCEPGAFRDPTNDGSSLGGIRDSEAKEPLDDIRSQLMEEYCWPAWLDQNPPLGMPICPTN
jgi:hypothetical protein